MGLRTDTPPAARTGPTRNPTEPQGGEGKSLSRERPASVSLWVPVWVPVWVETGPRQKTAPTDPPAKAARVSPAREAPSTTRCASGRSRTSSGSQPPEPSPPHAPTPSVSGTVLPPCALEPSSANPFFDASPRNLRLLDRVPGIDVRHLGRPLVHLHVNLRLRRGLRRRRRRPRGGLGHRGAAEGRRPPRRLSPAEGRPQCWSLSPLAGHPLGSGQRRR